MGGLLGLCGGFGADGLCQGASTSMRGSKFLQCSFISGVGGPNIMADQCK